MKEFEYFLRAGLIKKQSPNIDRAISLIKESDDKKNFLELTMRKIPSDKMNSNFVIESCYDIIMELVRAKMFISGFKSENSHEAEVSYLRNLSFSEEDISFVDELRYNRNGIKYYGRIFEKDYADKVLEFMKSAYYRLKRSDEMKIEVRKPTEKEKQQASNWGIWEKEVSEFPWEYDEKETCLILEGKVEVTSEDGKKVKFSKGDWVVFPQGLKCRWNITEQVRKHYKFG